MSSTGYTPGTWEYVEELGEVWAEQEGTDPFRVCIVEASNADGRLLAGSKDMMAFLDKFLEVATSAMPVKLVTEARNLRDRIRGGS